MNIGQAEEKANRRDRTKKRTNLLRLLKAILSGSFNSKKYPLENLFNTRAPRFQYRSPDDRQTTNYGYMKEEEGRAGTPYM